MNSRKKLLFVVYGLGIGGVEKCLVNLVNRLDDRRYKITIAIMNPEYELLRDVKPSIKVIRFEDQFINTTDTIDVIRSSSGSKKRIGLFLRYILYRFAVKLNFKPWKLQHWINEEYDYSIAYTHTGYVPNYVIDRTKAKEKVLWYHTTWTDPANISYYQKFDYIVAVSKYCKENFARHYPELQNRTEVLYNMFDFRDIVAKSQSQLEETDAGTFTIVTVGRLSPEKGFELAIKSCAALKNITSRNFVWYWVGGGNKVNEETARDLIAEKDLEGCFCLLGNRLNPYPYMRECSLYVQPSEREAFCTTIIEAKALKKPIVSTATGSIDEQICDGKDGFVVPHSPNAIAEKIFELMEKPNLMAEVAKNCLIDEETNERNLKEYDAFFGWVDTGVTE